MLQPCYSRLTAVLQPCYSPAGVRYSQVRYSRVRYRCVTAVRGSAVSVCKYGARVGTVLYTVRYHLGHGI